MKSILGTAIQQGVSLLDLQAPVKHGGTLLWGESDVNVVLQKFYLIPKPVPVVGMQNAGLLTECQTFVSILPSKGHSVVQEDQDDKTEDTQKGIEASLQMC